MSMLSVFIMLCLKSSSAVPVQRAGGRVCRHQMPFDYKYKWAVDGFSHGIKQPVPLAEVEAHREPNGYFYIGFINGVTRTHWLLAILSSFPDWGYGKESAGLLHQAAGLGISPLVSSPSGNLTAKNGGLPLPAQIYVASPHQTRLDASTLN